MIKYPWIRIPPKRLTAAQLWLLYIAFSVLVTELIVSGMELLLKGSITYDYLLTGLVASLFVAGLVVSLLTMHISRMKQVKAELQRLACVDSLTGVSNRGHFLEQAESELGRALRYNSALSILMMDIDHFKRVNDTYGHKMGDEVLKKVGDLCRTILRDVDIIGRLGGEEFAILLPETPGERAADVAERLRMAIESTKIVMERGLPLQFTASIGVSSLTTQDENLDVLLSSADQALYESKRLGRNKVSIAKT